MNTPNPLVPQGSLPYPSRGKSTVRIAVLTIVAIHAVFFAGLLMQGCKREDATKPPGANRGADRGCKRSELARLDTNYYQALPETAPPTTVAVTPPTNTGTGYAAPPSPAPVVTAPPATELPPVTAPVET